MTKGYEGTVSLFELFERFPTEDARLSTWKAVIGPMAPFVRLANPSASVNGNALTSTVARIVVKNSPSAWGLSLNAPIFRSASG